MFAYLSKKIAIPNNSKLNCLAWNKDQGYIACGGADGLLKCLLLEPGKEGKVKGMAVSSNLSMNQTLEGHSGNIQVITWNEMHQKLTTSDQSGLIIVWMLYKGSWYEEMINNRNKSVVKGMCWNAEGQKICIVYEDGAVIVGSVDGNRIWGKELKINLTGVEWSPDGKMLLFSLRNGLIQIYDNQGNFMMPLTIHCITDSAPTVAVAMHWYNGKNGFVEPGCPTLAICYDNGCLQIMKGHDDEQPVLLDIGMAVVCGRWNHDGSILAVAGKIVDPGPNKDVNCVQFLTPFGENVRTLKVPGRDLTYCEWEGRSLRVALAVDSYIYFANIRPDYKWTYFERTLVVSYKTPDRDDTAISFWDTDKSEVHVKHVSLLISIASYGQHCMLGTRVDGPLPYALVLCNAISTPVDTKHMEMEPLFLAMNAYHAVACSRDNFLVWNYQTAQARAVPSTVRYRKERLYHIDDTPSGVSEVIQDLDQSYEPATSTHPSVDPITCIAVSETTLVLGRESGTLQRYTFPQIALTNRYSLLASRPLKLAINCNSTRLSVIDHMGIMTLVDLEANPSVYRPTSSGDATIRTSEASQELAKFERKDVWAMQWASDNPDLLAIMEKTRMYIFRGLEPEEPIVSNGYICLFQDLEIRTALIDEILRAPDQPYTPHILDLEVKSLRDTRNLLDQVGIREATTFIEENPHPRLWRLLAEKALQGLALPTAEAAFVRCNDYQGILLIKQLHSIHNDNVKRAEVAAYLKDFDRAEKLYMEVDRRDLAITLREKLGDWPRVLQLMKMGPGTTDAQMKAAYNCIGDDLIRKQNWATARQYYKLGDNIERLVECHYHVEDYDALQECVAVLPEKHALLVTIADMFATIGMCAPAVTAYLKAGDVGAAVGVCVDLNQWKQAVDLATEHNFADTKQLLDKYGQHLLDNDQIMEAIELYYKSQRYLDAANLIYKRASATADQVSLFTSKKMYVLAALMVEEHKKATADAVRDNIELRRIEYAWEGAEAYHFLILAHKQLYRDHVDSALRTALCLRDYVNIVDREMVFTLIALASLGSRAYNVCARSFIQLETLKNITDSKRSEYEELAMSIVIHRGDEDISPIRTECKTCDSVIPDSCGSCPICGTKFPVCLVSGRPLMDPAQIWTCIRCRHSALDTHMRIRDVCPLCHQQIQQE